MLHLAPGSLRSKLALALAIAGAGLLFGGCSAEFVPGAAVYAPYDDYGYYVQGVPPDIYGYPHTYYNGSYAYWYNDMWLYPTSRGWATYRYEPSELRRYRTQYYSSPNVYRAPRVYPTPYYGTPRVAPSRVYTAPPARPPASRPAPVYVAPPASRPAPVYVAPPASRPAPVHVAPPAARPAPVHVAPPAARPAPVHVAPPAGGPRHR